MGNLAVMRIICLTYENGRVRKCFTDYAIMQKEMGIEMTKTTKKHVDRLKSSVSFLGFVRLGLGKPHSLKGNFNDCYGIVITGNIRLVVKPVCEDLSPESLAKCSEVLVKGVGDYHGEKIEWIIS